MLFASSRCSPLPSYQSTFFLLRNDKIRTSVSGLSSRSFDAKTRTKRFTERRRGKLIVSLLGFPVGCVSAYVCFRHRYAADLQDTTYGVGLDDGGELPQRKTSSYSDIDL